APIPDQSGNENTEFSLNVAANFNLETSYTLSGAAFLAISAQGIISGTLPNVTQDTNYTVNVTALNAEGSVSDSFILTIRNVLVPPTLVTPIPDQSGNENAAFTLNISSNFEKETSYEISGVTFLSVDANGIISGTLPEVTPRGERYDVTVTARNVDGSVSDIFAIIVTNVNKTPIAVIGGQNGTSENETVLYLATLSSDPDGNISAWEWSISGDANIEGPSTWEGVNVRTNEVPVSGGSFTLTLRVKDNEDLWSVAVNKTVPVQNINKTPVAEITGVQTVFENDVSTFSADTSSDEDGTINAWEWSITGDGNIEGAPNTEVISVRASSVPSNGGEYTLFLKVKDNEELWSPLVSNVVTVQNVNITPNAHIDGTDLLAEEDIELFSAEGSGDPDGNITAWEWSITGDGILQNPVNEDHVSVRAQEVSPSGGRFTLSLKVEDNDGAWSNVVNKRVDVFNVPRPPVVLTPIPDQSGNENTAFSLNVSENFAGETAYDLSGAAFLSINTEGIISGTLPNVTAEDSSFPITITALNGEGETSDTFTLTIKNIPHPPQLLIPETEKTLREASPFSLNISGNFANVSGFSLSGPEFLSISPLGVISGTLPSVSASTVYPIQILAENEDGITGDTFFLLVADTFEMPPICQVTP
ncbi:hypothetical protein HZA38_02080, partial [Candidatus Peregrinibacteria bacterium]|nr:hypothetical protein [Candidatus Peregrinibacteria bacterium]